MTRSRIKRRTDETGMNIVDAVTDALVWKTIPCHLRAMLPPRISLEADPGRESIALLLVCRLDVTSGLQPEGMKAPPDRHVGSIRRVPKARDISCGVPLQGE